MGEKFIVGYCPKCKEWKSQPIGERCADCSTVLINYTGHASKP